LARIEKVSEVGKNLTPYFRRFSDHKQTEQLLHPPSATPHVFASSGSSSPREQQQQVKQAHFSPVRTSLDARREKSPRNHSPSPSRTSPGNKSPVTPTMHVQFTPPPLHLHRHVHSPEAPQRHGTHPHSNTTQPSHVHSDPAAFVMQREESRSPVISLHVAGDDLISPRDSSDSHSSSSRHRPHRSTPHPHTHVHTHGHSHTHEHEKHEKREQSPKPTSHNHSHSKHLTVEVAKPPHEGENEKSVKALTPQSKRFSAVATSSSATDHHQASLHAQLSGSSSKKMEGKGREQLASSH
jgi:hypothetical protein